MNTSHFVSFICISSDSNTEAPVSECKTLDVTRLSPMDGLRVVLEQYIFATFVDGFQFSNQLPKAYVSTYYDKIRQWFALLPPNIHTNNSALDAIYENSYQLADRLLYSSSIEYTPTNGEISILKSILQYSANDQCKNPDYYCGSLTESFLTEYLVTKYGYFDNSIHPEKALASAPLYIPDIHLQSRKDYIRVDDSTGNRVVIRLVPLINTEFNFLTNTVNNHGVLDYFSHFNFRDFTITDLVGMLASFRLQHINYDMAILGIRSQNINIPEICFGLVSGRSYDKLAGLSDNKASSYPGDDVCAFFQWIKNAIELNRLRPITEYELFGELLQSTQQGDDKLVRYFTKPVSTITAMEALAFQNSVYSSYIRDRVIAGMEAADEDANEDDKVDGNEEDMSGDTDDDAELGDTEDPADMDMSDTPADASMDESTDTPSDDTADPDTTEGTENEKKDKAPIDPEKMLLELAPKNPSLRDYLFRDIVAKRIDNILKNPPENAMPSDLLLLKKWRSHWLYLTSIACLRDFLMRLNIRLSDV